jgi:hypothetical protein
VSSTVSLVEGGATVELRNDGDETLSISDARVLVPLNSEGAVVGSAPVPDVYVPPSELRPGASLGLGSPASVATSDCTVQGAGGQRPPIADGEYDFVYLVSVDAHLYKSERIRLSVTHGDAQVAR